MLVPVTLPWEQLSFVDQELCVSTGITKSLFLQVKISETGSIVEGNIAIFRTFYKGFIVKLF